MIEEMISSDKSWDSIKIFIESVMKEKLGDERQLLRGGGNGTISDLQRLYTGVFEVEAFLFLF
jgi:hypothetical protein